MLELIQYHNLPEKEQERYDDIKRYEEWYKKQRPKDEENAKRSSTYEKRAKKKPFKGFGTKEPEVEVNEKDGTVNTNG